MSERSWQKVILAGVGAAGAATILYCLLKDEAKGDKIQKVKELSKGSVSKLDKISKDRVQQILKEISEDQELMKGHCKSFRKELQTQSFGFGDLYDRIRERKPARDTLKQHGLSTDEFEQLLANYESDTNVRDAMAKIMGISTGSSESSQKVQALSVKKIIEVYSFMFKELESVAEQCESTRANRNLEREIVMIAAQTIVEAKVETKFDITNDDIESAVRVNHEALATDQEFKSVQEKIVSIMGKLTQQ